MKKIYLDNNNQYSAWAGSFVLNHEKLINIENLYLVNLTKEYSHLVNDLSIPLPDYSVPQDIASFDDSVKQILEQIVYQQKQVVFGCLGGSGRTGLLLGVLYKIFGSADDENVVEKVRENLVKSALETQEQETFVLDYNPVPCQNYLKKIMFYKDIMTASTPEEIENVKTQIMNLLKSPGRLDTGFIQIIKDNDKKELLDFLVEKNIIDMTTDKKSNNII